MGEPGKHPTDELTGFENPLLETITAVTASLNPADLLTELAKQLAQTFNVTSAYITDWNPETGLSTVLAEYFSPEAKINERQSDKGISYNLYEHVWLLPDTRNVQYPVLLQIDDPTLAPQQRAHMEQYDSQTILMVPLIAQDSVIGFAELWESRHRREFTPTEIEFCQGFAQQATIALVNARLYEAESLRRREAETLLEVAGYLTSTLELDEVLARTLDAIHRYLNNITNCSISILEDDGRIMRTQAEWHEKLEHGLVLKGETVVVEETLYSRFALKNRQPVAVSDLWQAGLLNERATRFKERGLRAFLYVPLLVRQKPIGLLHIHVWHNARHFTHHEIALCQSVAHQAAIAIENAHLYTTQNRQLKLAQMLQKVGALLTTSLSLSQVYEYVFEYLAEIIEYDFVSLHLEDVYTGNLELTASRGHENALNSYHFSHSYAETWLKRVPIPPGWALITDMWQDSDAQARPNLGEVRSWIGAVLMIKDRLIGLLSLESKTAHKYSAETAVTVAAFANQAAIAIANARLHDQVLQQADELAILHQIAIATASTFDVDELLRRTTRMITNRLYPDVFGFVMVDWESGVLRPHPSFFGLPPTHLSQPVLYESLIGLVVQTGEPSILADVRQEPLYAAGIPVDTTRSAITVPMQIKGTVVGVINAESPRLNAFTEKDLHFLVTLAGQVTAVMERAKLYEGLLDQKESLEVTVVQRTTELQVERDQHAVILESAGEGVILTDERTHILYVNPAVERMSGYAPGELLGQEFRLLASRRVAPALLAETWSTIFGRTRWSGEFLNQRKDGESYSTRLTITPTMNREGDISGYVILQSDISTFKEVEQLKAEFIANITHDLRTPLTNIKTYIALLQRGRPENHPRYFSVLNQETNRLNHLIQGLLDMARLDAEFIPDPQAATDVVALLVELKTHFGEGLQEKKLQWQLDLPDEVIPQVHLGQGHLRTVLTHLLDNAIRYSADEGSLRIGVCIRQRTGQMFAVVQICNDGPGIEAAEVGRVFDRFYRGEVARAWNVPGTGLGLPVTRKIVEQYGGLIELSSQPGGETCFTVWLPLVEGEEWAG